MPEVQFARARKTTRTGRVPTFMDAAVVVIPRRAGSFRGPGAEEGIRDRGANDRSARDATPRARARRDEHLLRQSRRGRQPRRP